ncbi:AMP-binding protein [Aquabacterium sp. A7-Y]|uniref:AMP-binding protein n=1 Tax=Aquabacterium sp. A7-Y TaxID=1349605 RepID=UPI00223D9AF8|nr:AMP-binding protein [Aquabacterium sp. A7-Y]MCW7540836.1 AMP-binding protein [Aquabacterium sp. A7-Y]
MGVPIPETERVWLKSYRPDVPFEIEPERYRNLNVMFEENVKRYSSRVAFVSAGSEMSYARCGELARAFAAWLHHAGVRQGDRVALMMPNSLQYPVCLFGALLAGAIVVNVNPLYTARELAHQLKDSGAETVVAMEMFAGTLAEALPGTVVRRVLLTGLGDLFADGLNLKGRCINLMIRRNTPAAQRHAPLPGAIRLRRALAAGRGLPRPQVDVAPQDLAFLQYTGGTTGVAKGAMLSHRNIVANLLQTLAWRGNTVDTSPIETNLSLLPLYHIFSLTVNCLIFMCLGGRNVLVANPRDVHRVMKTIRREDFTGIAGVSTLFNSFLEDDTFRKRDFSRLRLTIAGGMATPQAIAERWQQLTGKSIIEGYGLTECSPIVTINPIHLDHPERMQFNGTIGLPVPSTEVRLRRDDGQWAPLGEPGELCVRGPQVMRGYWKRPDETAKVIDAEGWLSTGDVGVMDEHGYVRLIDRKKDMILVSGFNVYPNEIEDVVMQHPGVREAAALGVPDPVAGERVKIVVVRKDPALREADLIEHCRAHLVGYKMPRVIEFREQELPKSNVGKILRRELR